MAHAGPPPDDTATNDDDRARLFAAAGLVDGAPPPITDPRLRRIDALLRDAAVPERVKATMDDLLRVVVIIGEVGCGG
jgi:hypothetical protein